MFKTFIKILLTTLFFSILLHADGDDIIITVSNSDPTDEGTGNTNFTIQLSRNPDLCDEVTVNYWTQDSSAKAESDYTDKNGSVTFYGSCIGQSASKSETIHVNIIDDDQYEPAEYFYFKISNSTLGYEVADDSGYAWINDNDPKPIKLTDFEDQDITEEDSDITLNMIAVFNQKLPSDITLTYHTEDDDSAVAGTDYVGVSTTITVDADSNQALLPVTIKGDLTPENSKHFKVIIDSISEGNITADKTAIATIDDDDTIEVEVECYDEKEGATGESNDMICRIFLANEKPYPAGEADFDINYVSADGSDKSATEGDDYTAVTGHVTFKTGDIEHNVTIPTIGDDEIEPNENVKLIISGSTYINKTESEAQIINDDGSYPTINFSTGDFSIEEGNSSTKVLNFHFTLDKDAIAGTSFDYYTEDGEDDDKAEVADNDYQEINVTTYTIPEGTKDINISVTINGDEKIEEDEIFYLKITNLKKLKNGGDVATGTITNDDGSYPTLSFTQDSYSIDEGDSEIRDINFTLTLDKPALENSHFDYKTINGSAIGGEDFVEINTTTYDIGENELNITISVQIKGDTDVESNQQFYLSIDNESENLHITGTQTPSGNIINDDHAPLAIKNVGEFRFDDCGADEWRIDHSSTQNNALGTVDADSIISGDDKSYMCTSINGYDTTDVKIPHHSNYELTEGTFSMLLYDHHNISNINPWLFQKGILDIQSVRVDEDQNKGSIDVNLDGNTIHTNELFFTNSDGGDSDTQWVHVTFTFGQEGMKLYINGKLKGTNPYKGGISAEHSDIILSKISGYYDEFYIFEGQMNDTQVESLYKNTIDNRNIDGSTRDCGCYVPSDPFTCNNSMYISSSTNRETGDSGKMWLHRIDTTQNPFDFIVIEDTGATELYNATAYNPDDDYIYGLYYRELVRLSRGAEVTNLGKITELPERFDDEQLYAGAISDGFYYVSGRRTPQNIFFKIKLSDFSVTEINLSKEVAIQDFSFYKNVNDINSTDGIFLYGVDREGKLTKIDVRDGNVTQIGSDHSEYEFDSSFSDKNGRFFANDSNGKGFFEFNLEYGTKQLISNSQSATFNDGANCINAELLFNDYGDAPSSYGSPKHNIANGIFMGVEIDHDITVSHSVDADGDDTTGVDDEDGITFVDGTDINSSYFDINGTQELNITVSKDGYLNAWIDFGIDGSFTTAGDQIITAKALTKGTHTISFDIPSTATTNQTTYIRFRYSSTSNLDSTQDAMDGEIEDYAIKFASATQPLKGIFNIERTDSGTFTIKSSERNAWYTQIVGRDFDYSLLFYNEDFNQEKTLNKVTVKIELLNELTNQVLYTRYAYINNDPVISRIDIISGINASIDDLASLPATKRVRFRVSYGVDINGGIIQQECLTDPKSCFDSFTTTAYNDAQDNFAIRPERFFIKVNDNSNEKINSDYPTDILRLASGYEYNLSIIATEFNNHLGAKDYNKTILENFDFNTTGLTNCMDESNISQNINFNNGVFINSTFTQNNVGKYNLTIKDDENWTEVDRVNGDCIEDNASTSSDSITRSGCNISVKQHGINLEFYPYQFNVALTQNNLPSSIHPDYIYMSELSADYHETSIQFVGDIIAQTKNGTPATNFTSSCMAKDVILKPTATLRTEDGVIVTPNKILTASNYNTSNTRETIHITRMERFNNEDFNVSKYINIDYIDNDLNITKDKFIDGNSGLVNLDLRYNIQKHLTKTINPIQITFNNIDVKSEDAYSEANKSNHYVPTGNKDLNNTVRNFYFAQVAPDRLIYPRVNFAKVKIIKTPLNVDIFCNRPKSYCQETNIFDNTVLSSSPRKQEGWYLSVNHDTNMDGKVNSLTPLPNNATTTVPPISFNSGRAEGVSTTLLDCSVPTTTIIIGSDKAIEYNPKGNPPYYKVECVQNADAEWAGIGETGNLIDTKANRKIGGKMDW